MAEHDQYFKPQEIDEQIARLSQPALSNQPGRNEDELLIAALRHIYTPADSEEDQASLQHVKQLLMNHGRQEQDGASSATRQIPFGAGYRDNAGTRKGRSRPIMALTFKRLLSVIAAVLVVGFLLAGFLLIRNMNGPQLTLFALRATSEQENVYMARNNHVVKLDGQTGAIIWQYTLTPPPVNSPATCLQIANGVVYAILDYDYYALRSSNGALLWHISAPTSQTKNLSCQVVGSRIYVLHRDGTYSGLDTKDGKELWRSPVVLTDSMLFEVRNGAIYSEQNIGTTPRLSALDTTTGKERWHADLQVGNTLSPTLEAEGIIYHTTSNLIYAINEATGQILWQQRTDNQAITFGLASVVNGVLYAETGTSDPQVGGECTMQPPALVCQASTFHVSAFDARTGKLLWQSDPGLHLYRNDYLYGNDNSPSDQPDLPVVNGVVLTYQLHNTTLTLYALDAKSGAKRWQFDVKCAGNICGTFPTILAGNTITLIEIDSQGGSIRLLTLDMTSGRQTAQHALSFQNQGRPVAFAGMDSQRIYVLAKGNENTLDVIHGLSIANGKDIWHYQVDNYASGSIEMPIIAA